LDEHHLVLLLKPFQDRRDTLKLGQFDGKVTWHKDSSIFT